VREGRGCTAAAPVVEPVIACFSRLFSDLALSAQTPLHSSPPCHSTLPFCIGAVGQPDRLEIAAQLADFGVAPGNRRLPRCLPRDQDIDVHLLVIDPRDHPVPKSSNGHSIASLQSAQTRPIGRRSRIAIVRNCGASYKKRSFLRLILRTVDALGASQGPRA
jgi:hypothetical protein